MKNFSTANIEPKLRVRDARPHFNAFTITLLVLLILYTVSLFTPLVWGLLRSFQKQSEFRLNIIGLPKKWVWNYSYVFKMFFVRVPSTAGVKKVGMGLMFLYAFLYSLGCAFTSTLIPCVTAYLCARYKFRFSKVIYTTVIVTMVLPIVGALPSEIRVAKALGLYDKLYGLWLMKANFLGLYFLVFHGIFRTLPMAYTEAAKIDGAGNLSILVKIILPLVRNTFFTVMLINFIGFWNDYQTPLIYMPSYPTIALGMFYMASTTENGLSTVPMRMTGAMLMLIPILVLFLCFHKRLLGNLTVGGLKG